jgi:predicted RNA-binding protein Jag
LSSESEGEDPDRCVVVLPAWAFHVKL